MFFFTALSVNFPGKLPCHPSNGERFSVISIQAGVHRTKYFLSEPEAAEAVNRRVYGAAPSVKILLIAWITTKKNTT